MLVFEASTDFLPQPCVPHVGSHTQLDLQVTRCTLASLIDSDTHRVPCPEHCDCHSFCGIILKRKCQCQRPRKFPLLYPPDEPPWKPNLRQTIILKHFTCLSQLVFLPNAVYIWTILMSPKSICTDIFPADYNFRVIYIFPSCYIICMSPMSTPVPCRVLYVCLHAHRLHRPKLRLSWVIVTKRCSACQSSGLVYCTCT